jgi:RND family efflux transporter MFP subunit
LSDQLSSDLASLRIQRDVDPDRRSPLRILLTLIVVLAIAGGAAAFVYPRLKAQIFKTEVSITEISMVSPAQASITFSATGYVSPQVISKVGAKVPGRVARVAVKEGDVVKTGDVLVELDNADQRSAINAAQARVAAAKARADAARANLAEVKQLMERSRTLVEKGVTGRADLDDQTARSRSLEEAAKAADADMRATATEVDSLRVALKDRTIYAPIDGTIITKPPEVGELVGLQTMGALVEIADFRSLVVETDVPENRLHMIKIGSPCEIVLDAYPSKRHRGATLEIGKRVNRAKATVTVKVKFADAADGALPDMSARVSFLGEELSAEAMKEAPKRVVPTSAVVERGGGKVVFLFEGGKVRMVPVTLGGPAGGGLELIDGPPPGSRVISNPSPELADGQKVKEKEAGG